MSQPYFAGLVLEEFDDGTFRVAPEIEADGVDIHGLLHGKSLDEWDAAAAGIIAAMKAETEDVEKAAERKAVRPKARRGVPSGPTLFD